MPIQPAVAPGPGVTGEIGPDKPLVLETVTADGAKVRAEFAAGAAPFPITVTMRPLASAAGLAGAAEGVELEPAGLRLIAPAVLTIDGPVASNAASRAFGYEPTTSGAAAFPEIAASGSGPMRILVSHFSGYGATSDSPAQWNIGNITSAEASELIALERFVIANAFTKLKQHQISDADASEIIGNAMQAITDATERLATSAVKRAENGSPDAATQVELMEAVAVILGAERANQLSGREGSPAALREVARIVDLYSAAVAKHCATNHDLTVLTLLFSLARESALLGGDQDDSGTARLRKCLSVEVRFRTTVTQTETRGELRFGAIVPVTLLFGDDPAPSVPYTAASTLNVGDQGCRIDFPLDPGTFTVTKARLIAAPPPPPAPVPASSSAPPGFKPVPPLDIVDASVEFSLGDSILRKVIGGQCSDQEDPSSYPFYATFDGLHPAESRGGGKYEFTGGFTIPGGGSPVLARRTIEREQKVGPPGPDGTVQAWRSTTIIEIVHTPG
ncbi:MAG: hypothetical protein ACJ77B_07380 [Chloroflexota bacterium]